MTYLRFIPSNRDEKKGDYLRFIPSNRDEQKGDLFTLYSFKS